jgi:hypothetical protein
MTKDGLGNLYSNFTGEERFRLHMEALYRGDEAEDRRLLESCPRETSLKYEAGFADRCTASREIVNMLCWALASPLARLRTIQSFREARRRTTSGLEEASGEFLSCLAELERELAEEVLTMWEAFAHFCIDELLLQPEKLVKVWFEPMLPEIERLKDLSASTKLNPEMLKGYEADLKKMWGEIARLD